MSRPLRFLCLALFLCAAASAQEWRAEPHRFGRSQLAMAWDPDRQALVVFGGDVPTDAAASATTSEWDGRAWRDKPATPAPGARSGHAMVFDAVRRQVLLFGGSSGGALLGDTWAWDGTAWRRLDTSTAPSARTGHRMAWDARHGQAMLFGGRDASGYQNDTWRWNGTAWQQATPAQRPPARADHGLAFDPVRGRSVLQGGVAGGTVFDDTWEWDGWIWQQIGVPGRRMQSHVLFFDPTLGTVVMHGGIATANGQQVLSDLLRWDPVTRIWSLVSPASSTNPGPRCAHAVAASGGRVLLLGGTDSASRSPRFLLDLWDWDGHVWTRRFEERMPMRRTQGELVYDPLRQRTVFYGGLGDNGTGTGTNLWGDTWEWDGASWTQVPVLFPRPQGRSLAHSTWDSRAGHMLLFGGDVNGTLLAETWAFNGVAWRVLDPGTGGLPRSSGAMCFDVQRGRAVLFGGQTSTASPAAATSEWDGTAWRRLTLAVEPTPRFDPGMAYDLRRGRTVLFGGWAFGQPQPFSDTWEFDGSAWTRVFPAHAPPARRGHRMSYDTTHNRIVLFGGDQASTVTTLADLWAFDGTDWTRIVPTSPSPPGRVWHAQAWDIARDRLVVVGGSLAPSVTHFGLDQWELTTSGLTADALAPPGYPLTFLVTGAPGAAFVVLCAGARAPGIPLLPGALGAPRTLPLASDLLLRLSLGLGLGGTLDPLGMGVVQLWTPADPALIGLVLYGAGVLVLPGGGLDVTEDERMLIWR